MIFCFFVWLPVWLHRTESYTLSLSYTHTHTHMHRQYTSEERVFWHQNLQSLWYDMRVHRGKDSGECNWWNDSDTSVRHCSEKVEIVGHKLFVDTFFPSPNLCCYLKNRSCHKAGSTTWLQTHSPENEMERMTFKPESGEIWLHQPPILQSS
jgi:hypothetical protein